MTTNQKHFKACNRTTGDEIFFGLEDISCETVDDYYNSELKIHADLTDNFDMEDWLEDYQLYYYHDKEWFPYNTEEVEK